MLPLPPVPDQVCGGKTKGAGTISIGNCACPLCFSLLLLLCALGVFLATWPVASLIGAIIVSLALVGRFTSVLISYREKLGEFAGTTAGMVAIIVVIGGVLVIILSVVALFTESRPPATL
jgi:hypothetical protein